MTLPLFLKLEQLTLLLLLLQLEKMDLMLLLLLMEARRLGVRVHPRRRCRCSLLDPYRRRSWRADGRWSLYKTSGGGLQRAVGSMSGNRLLLLQHHLLLLQVRVLLTLLSLRLCQLGLLLTMLGLRGGPHFPFDLLKCMNALVQVRTEIQIGRPVHGAGLSSAG